MEQCSLEGTKEGNVLFNDALNTFYLQLYGVSHMVKDHSDIHMDVFVYIKTVGKTAGHHGSCFGEIMSPVGKVGFSPNTNTMMGLVKMSQKLWLHREIIVV